MSNQIITGANGERDLIGLPLDSNGWPKEIEAIAIMSYSLATKQHFLHSIDTTHRLAEAHLKMVTEEYRLREERARVWKEKITLNHAFAGGFKV